MDADKYVFSVNTKHFVKDFENLDDLFHFNILSKNDELFSNENNSVIEKFKIDTPKRLD